MIDFPALQSEIQNDPSGLGYTAHVAAGRDQAVADLLNAPSVGIVTLTSVDNATFVTAFLPFLPNVAGLADANKKDMYWRIWEAIISLPTITFGNPNVSGMLALAVQDGVLTQQQAQTLTQRQGSRAEVLFGAATVVTNGDVSFALRGQR